MKKLDSCGRVLFLNSPICIIHPSGVLFFNFSVVWTWKIHWLILSLPFTSVNNYWTSLTTPYLKPSFLPFIEILYTKLTFLFYHTLSWFFQLYILWAISFISIDFNATNNHQICISTIGLSSDLQTHTTSSLLSIAPDEI